MKIMVTGPRGMLGCQVIAAAERMGHEIAGTFYRKLEDPDITKEIVVADCCPDVVINCAGLVPQRDPPPTAAEMMLVNGYGPWNLAEWCDDVGARLIHVSSDCVFDGNGKGPHDEMTNPRPRGPYGRSKAAGEVDREPHLTVRTSFVGFGKRGLITELQLCAENGETYRASDALWWSGHCAPFVAEALVLLAERKDLQGVIHIPGEDMTRHDLVHRIKAVFEMDDLVIGRTNAYAVDRRLMPRVWEREGLPPLPPFDWQLEWLNRSRS
ncbi:MAG: sugar nucleotide-binding protein [Gemmatimonadales bacterium]|nr:sugar nucleotide-binding protein [Gemmatimonadales bacterium]